MAGLDQCLTEGIRSDQNAAFAFKRTRCTRQTIIETLARFARVRLNSEAMLTIIDNTSACSSCRCCMTGCLWEPGVSILTSPYGSYMHQPDFGCRGQYFCSSR